MENSIFHQNLVAEIKKLSVSHIKEAFEAPNKYGNIVSQISFKHDIQDQHNYSVGGLTTDFSNGQHFIPMFGYQELSSIEEIITTLKNHYKLK